VATYKLTVASVFILLSSCLGQERVWSITSVLSKAHVSGSLAYWSPGRCGSQNDRFPPFPRFRPANSSGSPREVLQEMFADNPKMQVTQEPGGMVRMAETDVPTDLLDVRIHHIEFSDYGNPPPAFTGPNIALQVILLTPEVQAFKKDHNIGPFGFRLPGDASFNRPHVYGELDDVTVSQALDYVLKTFPGFWVYGNCRSEQGDREVFFWFLESDPAGPGVRQ
jgi:hypothetical protein